MKEFGAWTLRFLGNVLKRSAIGIAIGLVVMLLPLPVHVDPLWRMLQAPIGALLIVCFVGKALYDTLFYDRYWP